MKNQRVWDGISEFQLYLFNEGTNFRSYEMLGTHKTKKGWRFAVWAPNARKVCLAGSFNGWSCEEMSLKKIGTTGVWYGTFENVCEGDLYKYAVYGDGEKPELKADPFAFYSELRPGTASIVGDMADFLWDDGEWIRKRKKHIPYVNPMLIYELHPGSWRKHKNGEFLKSLTSGGKAYKATVKDGNIEKSEEI